MKNHRALIGVSILSVVLATLSFPFLPLNDPHSYFNFADAREVLGIPNVGDVVSNLPFLLVGLYWLNVLRGVKSHPLRAYALILIWVSILTFFGSGYFHWSPSVGTLFWDRLPMSVGFSTIVGLIIADRMSSVIGWRATCWLAPVAAFTVFGYWMEWLSIRPYMVVQFGSLFFVLLVSLLQRRGQIRNVILWSALGLYAVAKAFEMTDHQIFNTLGFVSGHTLKHLFAAASIFVLLTFLREPKSKP